MNLTDLPALNATLNLISLLFLTMGYRAIKAGNETLHKKMMVTALICTVLFLTSYLIYHYNVGSVPYPYYDWTRPLYFTILIPHVILAALNAPFIIVLVTFAFKENFDRHKRLARYVFPVWVFVSITGVLVYLMLYQL